MRKYWILATLVLGLAACTDKPVEGPATEAAAPAPAPQPEPAAAPVASDAALQASDVDAYLRGLEKELQLLRDEYAKIEQARADDDSDAETAALFAMTSSAIDEAGAVASGLSPARYDYVKNRIDEIAALRDEAVGLRLKAAGG